jgi:hypothetical protein
VVVANGQIPRKSTVFFGRSRMDPFSNCLTLAIIFALWQQAMALVQFHSFNVTRFVYGGDVKNFRWANEPNDKKASEVR